MEISRENLLMKKDKMGFKLVCASDNFSELMDVSSEKVVYSDKNTIPDIKSSNERIINYAWKCHSCMKKFEHKIHLDAHLERFKQCILRKDETPKVIEPLVSIDNNEENKVYDFCNVKNSYNCVKCNACSKLFTTKASLERHWSRFPICKKLIEMKNDEDIKSYKPIHKFVNDLLKEVMYISENTEQFACIYCNTSYSNLGNLHKHYDKSVPCNNLAMKHLKRKINEV